MTIAQTLKSQYVSGTINYSRLLEESERLYDESIHCASLSCQTFVFKDGSTVKINEITCEIDADNTAN